MSRPMIFPSASGNCMTVAAVVALLAVLFLVGCGVPPEAMAELERIAAANEGHMADERLPTSARLIATDNAYANHQALWLLDSDYDRPAWVLELEAELAPVGSHSRE